MQIEYGLKIVRTARSSLSETSEIQNCNFESRDEASVMKYTNGEKNEENNGLTKRKIFRKILFVLLIVAFCGGSAVVALKYYRHEQKKSYKIDTILSNQQQLIEERKSVTESELLHLQTDDFVNRSFVGLEGMNGFQKLVCRQNVRILVVGDSIGALPWTEEVAEWIQKNYSVDCEMKNASLGGNSSYSGIVAENLRDDGLKYDFVILCYGQNDDERYFSSAYEALIRLLMENNPDCSIISIIESAQREYTPKMKSILKLAEYYHLSVADLIEGFQNSGYSYDALSYDGVHPTELGESIYAHTVEDVIRLHVSEEYHRKYELFFQSLNGDESSVEKFIYRNQKAHLPLDSASGMFEDVRIFPTEKFVRVNDTDWEIELNGISGTLGVSRSYLPGDNSVKVYLNDTLCGEQDYRMFINNSLKRISLFVPEVKEYHGTLRVSFSSGETADTFSGVIFTDYRRENTEE